MGLLLSKNPSNFVLLSYFLELLPMKKVYNDMLSLDTKTKNIVSLNARTGIKNTVSLTGKTNMASLVARTGRHLQRYDTVGYRQVVGCIPYRYRKTNKSEELEVLLISSQKGKGMLFPKGGWEEDEDIRDAALRETFEEAGVRGKLEEKLGMWPYKSKRCDIMHNGYMFPLLVNKELKQWPEQNIRKREWMTATKAREVCQQGWMKAALDELISRQMKNSDK
ncbi:hypothetical protein ACB098_04G066000 [Castanea mollissima]